MPPKGRWPAPSYPGAWSATTVPELPELEPDATIGLTENMLGFMTESQLEPPACRLDPEVGFTGPPVIAWNDEAPMPPGAKYMKIRLNDWKMILSVIPPLSQRYRLLLKKIRSHS